MTLTASDPVAQPDPVPPAPAPAPVATERRLWRSWFVYSLSSVASRLIGFLMLPIYTRVLSPEEFGIRAMVTVGVDLVGMVCSLGLTTAMIRHYTGDRGEGRQPVAVSTAYVTGALVLGTGVGLGLLAAPWLAMLVLGDAAYAGFLRLGLVSLFFINTMDIGLAYLRVRGRATTVALVSVSTLGLTLTSNIVLVVLLRWGVAGILYGEIATYALFSVLLARLTLREVGLRVSFPLARRMIAYGAPLTLMPFAWLLVNRSDGVFLTHQGSLAAAGIYALAIQCAQVLLMAIVMPFRDAWDPGQFELARDPDGQRAYRRTFQAFTFTIVIAALAFAVAADDVIRVMAAPQFHSAASVVPVLLAAHVVMGMSLFFNSGLLVKNRTALLGAVALVTAGVNVAANAILVPRYFALGAASSRLIALLVMAGLTYVLAQRLWPQRPDFAALAKVVALALAGFAVSRFVPDGSLIVSLTLKAALVVAVAVLGVGIGALDRHDVRRIATMLLERLGRWRRGSVADTTA
jgi:O-antigen/teichoic acid export membrane protein